MRHAIFPIYYYQTEIKEKEELKEKYLSAIVKSYHQNHIGSPSDWLTNRMHTSYGDLELNKSIFSNESQLKRMYLDYFNGFMDAPWGGSIDELWFNCYIDGDYQEQHNHVSCGELYDAQFSCIHYLSFDSTRHSPVTFCDPSKSLRSLAFDLDSHEYREGEIAPVIEEGDLIMFPSYLEHFVSPSLKTEDYPRVTISFNVIIKNYGALNSK